MREIEIEIDLNRTLHENASGYYEKAKKAKAKIARMEKLIESGINIREGEKKERAVAKRKWYEKYRWFISKSKFIVIAGRNANQNERLYKNIMRDNDLFMHAEIVGAPFTIIKNGVNADEHTLLAAAQFAVSYSRAWKFGYATADVYAVKKEQLTKKTSGMYVKKGAVIVLGERRWFRNVPLKLCIGFYESRIACFPELCKNLLKSAVSIVPGTKSKEEIAKVIANKLNANIDEVIALLPAGETDIA